ncbi:hypothetical protein [Pseudomonas gessardii]|uniref:hypothetical protein n=1 Tax=Pseudomonas gessardii TaxID=78544 RepID=UPI0014750829|nr:hypothetical protein [Pseudomonas gessardii]NNA67618.1 hypothetical protein [Pseudomonas gessardii]
MPKTRDSLRYQLYRSKALRLANASTQQGYKNLKHTDAQGTEIDLTHVRFELIDRHALAAYQDWAEDAHFSWDEVATWKGREPMAFDLSLWYDEVLCGLCFANPNQSRLRIKLIRLEGRPGKSHPLKSRIASLTMIAIDHYARIIGSPLTSQAYWRVARKSNRHKKPLIRAVFCSKTISQTTNTPTPPPPPPPALAA